MHVNREIKCLMPILISDNEDSDTESSLSTSSLSSFNLASLPVYSSDGSDFFALTAMTDTRPTCQPPVYGTAMRKSGNYPYYVIFCGTDPGVYTDW